MYTRPRHCPTVCTADATQHIGNRRRKQNSSKCRTLPQERGGHVPEHIFLSRASAIPHTRVVRKIISHAYKPATKLN